MEFDATAGQLPPLRPAALDAAVAPDGAQQGDGAPADAQDPLAPPKKIEEHEVEMYKEQDRYLPIANVGRIMKKCLPETTKVSKDAKECVQECTSEFISFITSEAAERCAVEKRKTINGEDILFAMATLGFEMYSEVMKVYLAKYREHQRSTGKRAQKRAAKEAAAMASAPPPEAEYDDDGEGYGESEGDME
ncbi:transcriptional activator hap3 [Rhodotorula kratochvilovae]